MSFWKKFVIVFAVFTLIGTPLFFHFFSVKKVTVYPQPTKYFYINDYSFVFSEEAEEYIYDQAEALEASTGAQLVVVAVPNTHKDTIEHYSLNLANEWGIGQKDADNGLLLLFTTEDPHVRMEVGRGLEGKINDARAGRLLDDYAVDAKDNGRWDEAAVNTFSATAKLIYEEYGVVPPETLVTNYKQTKQASGVTPADKQFPAIGEERNSKPVILQVLTAFGVFWAVAMLPFFFIMSLFATGSTKRKSKATGQRFDLFLINMIDAVLGFTKQCCCCCLESAGSEICCCCNDCDASDSGGGSRSGGGFSGGGHSGGGGSFGGGGATR